MWPLLSLGRSFTVLSLLDPGSGDRLAEELRVVHALVFLAERLGGWRSGLRWQLRGGWVYSPDLAAMLARGLAPRPPREAVEKVRRLVAELCGGGGACGERIVEEARRRAEMMLEEALGGGPGETLIRGVASVQALP